MARLLVGAITCTVLLAGFFYVRSMLRVIDGDSSWAFSRTMGEYLEQHDGVMPANWENFTTWAAEHNNGVWDPEYKSYFEIPWGQRISRHAPEVHITLLRSNLKYVEPYLNQSLADYTSEWSTRD